MFSEKGVKNRKETNEMRNCGVSVYTKTTYFN